MHRTKNKNNFISNRQNLEIIWIDPLIYFYFCISVKTTFFLLESMMIKFNFTEN